MPPGRRRASWLIYRWDKAPGYSDLPAQQISGDYCVQRNARSCPRWMDNIAGRHHRLFPNTSVNDAAQTDNFVGFFGCICDPAIDLLGLIVIREPMNEKTGRGRSPGCAFKWVKSTLFPSIRGGVPVFRRPTLNGSSRKRFAREMDGGSPARPPALWFSPM